MKSSMNAIDVLKINRSGTHKNNKAMQSSIAFRKNGSFFYR